MTRGGRIAVYRVLLAVALLGLWQLASGRWIDAFWISSPSGIVRALLEEAASGRLWDDLAVTLWETAVGYVAGAAAGIGCGFALGRSGTAARVLSPFLTAAYGIPRIALAPLCILWFGIGGASKMALAGMVAFFLTLFNTFAGVRAVDADLAAAFRLLGASERQVVRRVVLPSALPWVVTGLKVSLPQSLVAAVVGEFIAASRGLGFRIQLQTNLYDTAGVLAGVAVLAGIVIAANGLLDMGERRLLRWRPPVAGEAED